jgi:hypothetical protein
MTPSLDSRTTILAEDTEPILSRQTGSNEDVMILRLQMDKSLAFSGLRE